MSSRYGTNLAPAHAPALRITTTTDSGTARIVHLHGEVDQDQRQRLERALRRALDDRPPRLVVDLAGLSFCDSTGLNALLKTRLAANAAGLPFVLAAPCPQTRRLLEITGTDEVFTIRDSVHAALADTAAHTG
ncbi:STAS domain-containing protein [Kitasatospora sp. NPDC056076]|uniref:STAS domain-containing protein n=1 Tax=Kitasatospora sp. NPDC056076 TaxID=3345703 RepID=UPI0035E109A6